ncbi:G protein alpha subunit [Rhizoclosmatium globosum]|uniref:G protein alpha subunit n=1 Tax=Rhizoclosmatium globosum TaxID=329046 RepID=A0A1Y2BQA1_9FUNG|nr:G protein alpha subunit [Rhizoclosmatium globosum]|eukprot:ORY36929.1 G protein alpha subunit [Rhizoclosmatium globosum]
MGCTSSSNLHEEDAKAQLRAQEIDKQIEEERKKLENVRGTKLLLLGKSTILKQMKIIYGVGFTSEEVEGFRLTLLSNILDCITTLVAAMDTLEIPGDSTDDSELDSSPVPVGRNFAKDGPIAAFAKSQYTAVNKPVGKKRVSVAAVDELISHNLVITPKLMLLLSSETVDGFKKGQVPNLVQDAIEMIWKDSGTQYCYSRSNEYQLMECCKYVMEHMRRICSPTFKPTEEDILHSRKRTVTITETKFKADNVVYSVFDVGGQRSERKKWAPYFDNVQAIIFVVALSAYDQTCMEAEGMNRMIESINVFNSIIQFPLFKKTGIILFLNKIDLFKEKIQVTPISNFFSNFQENTYDNGCKFFRTQFTSLNKDKDRQLFTHFTWATDTKQIAQILKAVRECVQKLNLQAVGLVN